MAFEVDSYYIDKYSGKNIRLKPEDGLVTVAFESGAVLDVKRALTDQGWTPHLMTKGDDLSVAVASGSSSAEFASPGFANHQSVVDWTPVYRDQEGGRYYILPGQLDIQFVDGTDPERALRVIKNMGGRIVGNVRTPGYYSVTVPSDQGLFAAVRAFSLLPEVEFAVPSLLGEGIPVEHTEKVICLPSSRLTRWSRGNKVVAARSEPLFCTLWAFKNNGQKVCGTRGTKGVDIRMLAAWETTLGAPDVVIAVVDSGMDLDHPDLSPNLLPRGDESWNFIPGGDPDPVDDEDDGHGTGLCGVVAAALNGEGVMGVAPRCGLMPLKVALSGQLKTRAEAIYYAAERASQDRHRRYVINLSWVMPCDYPGVHRAVATALSAGALVVAGVGQSKTSSEGRDMDLGAPTYPASYPRVLAVTATDQDDHKGGIVDFGRRVDVCAPGANICTTNLGGTYCFRDGTSFATAYVSGLAALIWSLDKEKLTHDMIFQLIKQSCDPIDDKNPGLEGKLGAGRINAFTAVQNTLCRLDLGEQPQCRAAI
jgi:subtilisin family serine protease